MAAMMTTDTSTDEMTTTTTTTTTTTRTNANATIYLDDISRIVQDIEELKSSVSRQPLFITQCIRAFYAKIHTVATSCAQYPRGNDGSLGIAEQFGSISLRTDGTLSAQEAYSQARQTARLCMYVRERLMNSFPELELSARLPSIDIPRSARQQVRLIERDIARIGEQNDALRGEIDNMEGNFGSVISSVMAFAGTGSNIHKERLAALYAQRKELQATYHTLCEKMNFFSSITDD